MSRVGIFSGAFDPIHKGHLSFAKEALKQCQLEKIFFLIEPRPRRKQGVKALEHRRAMVTKALKPYPEFATIILEHFSPNETLPLLEARFKGAELFILMGDDQLPQLANWLPVAASVKFIVGLRKLSKTDVEAYLRTLQKTSGVALHYSLFQPSYSSYSSAKVRLALKHSKPVEGLLPSTLHYIRQHGLYSSSSTTE